MDLFINTSLKHMSIRSCLVSQPRNKLYSNSEQLFNVTDLLPLTFGVNLPSNPHGKNAINSQIKPNIKTAGIKSFRGNLCEIPFDG